MPTVPLGWCIN